MTCTRRWALGPTLLVLIAAAVPLDSARQDWRPLFNGRDLDGWTPKITGHPAGVNFGDTFRVEDGMIKVRYEAYGDQFAGRFGHLFHEQAFSHYRLRVEYRFVGEQAPGGPGWALRNSGVMVHGERPDQMTLDQEFPTSIEVQFLGGDGSAARTTSNLCTPGTNVVMNGELVTRHCTNSSSRTYHGDEWVTAEVEVCGNGRVRHVLDGELALSYEQPQLDPRDAHARALSDAAGTLMLSAGTISLQSESHPVDFRRVEILELDPASCESGAVAAAISGSSDMRRAPRVRPASARASAPTS
jgi:hypothetical protein